VAFVFTCRIPELVERARKLRVSSGFTPGADLGPLITKESKDRVLRLVQSGIDQGAAIPLDGRNVSVPYPSSAPPCVLSLSLSWLWQWLTPIAVV
jgi:acyl-CoA reductase-like NAD-dependent aldehyde dehydrogenase